MPIHRDIRLPSSAGQPLPENIIAELQGARIPIEAFQNTTVSAIRMLGRGFRGRVVYGVTVNGTEYAVKVARPEEKKIHLSIIKSLQDHYPTMPVHTIIIPIIDNIPGTTLGNYKNIIIMPVASNFDSFFTGYTNHALLYRWHISVCQTIMGLAMLHSVGYAHKDIRADNLLVYQGRVVLTDFGLSTFFWLAPLTLNTRADASALAIALRSIVDRLFRTSLSEDPYYKLVGELYSGNISLATAVNEIKRMMHSLLSP